MQGSFGQNVNWDDEPEQVPELPQDVKPPNVFVWIYTVDRRRVRLFFNFERNYVQNVHRGIGLHYIRPFTEENGVCHSYPKRTMAFPRFNAIVPSAYHAVVSNHDIPGVDYVYPELNFFFDADQEWMVEQCRLAERLDFEMAQTMQGLLGVNINMVWTCLDPSLEPFDRYSVFRSYVQHYVKSRMEEMSGENPSELTVGGIINEHAAACKQWVYKHFKGLTPLVTSAATMLVRKCWNVIPVKFHVMGELRVARMLWRNKGMSTLFQECVYWHVNQNDQSKNSRNPSYKQMTTVTHAHAQCYYKLIREMQGMDWNVFTVNPLDDLDVLFHEDTIDWHEIASQYPAVHHKYTLPLGGPHAPNLPPPANAQVKNESDDDESLSPVGNRGLPAFRRGRNPRRG